MYIGRYAYRQTVLDVVVSFFRFFSCYGSISFSLYLLGVFLSLAVSLFRDDFISLVFVSFVRSSMRPFVRSFVHAFVYVVMSFLSSFVLIVFR